MTNYKFSRPLTTPKYITVQGQARSGKGTLVKALVGALCDHYRIYSIDQGLKFRVFARMAIEQSLDYENLDLLESFVQDPASQAEALERLQAAPDMAKNERDEMYYAHQVGNVSGMFGKIPATHEVVVQLLKDEVRAAVGSYDIIVVDGRAMQKYGQELEDADVVDHILAIDVVCEPLVAARRVLEIFEPVEQLDSEQLVQLIHTTEDISRRNSSDARRKRDPSVFLHEAFELDVLHMPETDAEFERMCEKVSEVGVLSIDNSFTRSIAQLTEPSVKLIRRVVELSFDKPHKPLWSAD